MTSLYVQSIPVMTKYLRNLSSILNKGKAFADEKGMSHKEMLEFRLISDMRGYLPPLLPPFTLPTNNP